MKTFEEAMKLRIVRRSALERSKEELAGRYGSIVEEIGTSPLTQSFIRSVPGAFENIDEEMSDEERFFSILITCFINGVMVGIEMEKSD